MSPVQSVSKEYVAYCITSIRKLNSFKNMKKILFNFIAFKFYKLKKNSKCLATYLIQSASNPICGKSTEHGYDYKKRYPNREVDSVLSL